MAGLEDAVDLSGLRVAEASETVMAASCDADLSGLLESDALAVVDDVVDPKVLASMVEALDGVDFAQHEFVFEGARYEKPGIFEVDLESRDCEARAPPELVRRLRRLGEEMAAMLPVPCSSAAAIKLQRNAGGAFPAHYDNAGPPSKRAVTAVLYLGTEGGWTDRCGGELVLAPFLKRGVAVAPTRNRVAFFRSDRVLHWVRPWTGAKPRYCCSFWFDGACVNSRDETVLTKDVLRFSSWDACAEFFSKSPLQRTISRAVYASTYEATLAACVDDGDALAKMTEGHERHVAAIEGQLRPMVAELRRRAGELGPPVALN